MKIQGKVEKFCIFDIFRTFKFRPESSNELLSEDRAMPIRYLLESENIIQRQGAT